MMHEEKVIDHIDSSNHLGKLSFPSRTDYEDYFVKKGTITTPDELWQKDDLLIELQRHWHNRGQNGCVFAQAIASKAHERGWITGVVNKPVEELNNSIDISTLENNIQSAISNPDIQVQSLLFPQIKSSKDLVNLTRTLIRVPSVFIASESYYEYLSTVALRIAINEQRVLSWLMGFGPFDFFPNTRQAPITEIAIRVKPKPDKIFHRLNQDREAAHLADTPLFIEDCVAERLWQATTSRTRHILGGEPDHFSAAKVTFSLPKDLWIASAKD